ncbi:hypothetical protein F4604DRAFT_419054 [Suillus subluteus]|nr:hypothetical protein F4604DRAFT_419054 [Suillus subluteus]
MLPSKGPHPVESFRTSAAVPVALDVTGRQDGHRTCIGVSKPSTDVAMDIIMSQDPSPLPKIPSRNEEPREQLTTSNIPLTPVRTKNADSSLAEPRGMRPSPSVPVCRRQSVVSFASPLVTRPSFDGAVQIPAMTCLKSNIRSNNHGAFGNGIPETNTRPPKRPILDRDISLVSDDEFESSHPARKPSSNRVRFENVGLPYSLSPLTLKTSAQPVKQMPVQSSQEQRAKQSPRENSRRNIKSDEGNDIQDIVDVLSDIQTVIVKSIANKFKGVKKEVHAGREELLHDASEDLHALADA